MRAFIIDTKLLWNGKTDIQRIYNLISIGIIQLWMLSAIISLILRSVQIFCWIKAEYQLIFISSFIIFRSHILCILRLRDAMVSISSFTNHTIQLTSLLRLLQLLHIIFKEIAWLLLLQRKASLLLCILQATSSYDILRFINWNFSRRGYEFLNNFLLRCISRRKEISRRIRSIFWWWWVVNRVTLRWQWSSWGDVMIV